MSIWKFFTNSFVLRNKQDKRVLSSRCDTVWSCRSSPIFRSLLNRKSKLSLENKLIIYKHILKPIWTYGIELWGCSKPANTKILQSFQPKTLRMITGAPWYVSNQTLREELKIP
jgi:hypothetical protein